MEIEEEGDVALFGTFLQKNYKQLKTDWKNID
jgi:hypothetical protein